MEQSATHTTNARGVAYAAVAYAIWGLFPLYWRPLLACVPTAPEHVGRIAPPEPGLSPDSPD